MKNKNLKMLLIAGLAAGTLTCAAGGAVYASAYGNVNGTNTGTLTSAVTLSSFALDTGASVRTKDPMGIRFEAGISAEDLAKLPADADFGVLVMPTDILNGAELTKETSITKDGAETPATPEDIPAEIWHNSKCTETTKYYTGVIGGIEGADLPESYYDVDLTAVAYVTYKYTPEGGTEQTETIYTNTTTRSCVQVAATALKNKDGATWATPEAVQTLEGVVDTVVGEIAFDADTVTAPVGCAVSLPTVTGNDGLDIYYSAEGEGVTVSNGLVTCASEGSYTVTARLGSRVDTVTISAQTPTSLVTGLKAKAYTASEIESAVEIDVPKIGTSNITAAWGASYTVVDEDTVSVELTDKSVRGETSVCFATEDGIYSVDVVVADRKITTADEFKTMLSERMFADTAIVERETEYIVLANDIEVGDTKDASGNYYYSQRFYDTFDGRGNMIYGPSANGMWTSGMFGTLSGGTIKNLVVKNAIIRNAGYNAAVLTYSVNEGSTIENNVVIDTIHNASVAGIQTGILSATVWGDNNVIKNNLIIDTWTTKPALGNHADDGSLTGNNVVNFAAIYGAIGGSGLPKSLGGSANNTQIMDDNYVLSARDYTLAYHINGGNYQDKDGDSVADDYIDSKYMVNSLTELLGEVGKLSSFSTTAKRGMQIAYENAVARNSSSLSTELQAYLNDIIANMSAQSLTTMSSAPVFLASEITDGTVSITLPENTIEYGDIVDYSGCAGISGEGRTVTVTLADTSARGEVNFTFETADKEYSYTVVIADRKITSGDDFKTMSAERLLSAVPSTTEYIVLANTITLGDTKNASGSYYAGNFYDTFDGRGNMIWSGSDTSAVWTTGLFSTIQGGTVKNLVMKNIMIRADGVNAGALALSIQGGSTVTNNVIINPVLRATTAGKQMGTLAATVWGNNVIKNNVIIDTWTSIPSISNADNYNADGSINLDGYGATYASLYGAIGGSGLPTSLGGSANNTHILDDNYVICAHTYAGAYSISGGNYLLEDDGVTKKQYIDSKYMVADYAAFKTAVGDVAEFNSLIVDDGTTVTVGGVTIYTY